MTEFEKVVLEIVKFMRSKSPQGIIAGNNI